jgi:uncharacterized protein with HEPN domain
MKQNLPYLKHILDEINFLIDKTEGITFEDYLKDEVLTRATTRSFEIIGEAAKNLSKDFKNKHNKIEWKKIAGMRDKIIHCYFGVNWNIIWKTIKEKLPMLKREFEKLVMELEK